MGRPANARASWVSCQCVTRTHLGPPRPRGGAAAAAAGRPGPPTVSRRPRSGPHYSSLGLRSVGTPRISIGPAGYRINRDYARRGWATETGHPNWGPRDPGQCIKTVMVVR